MVDIENQMPSSWAVDLARKSDYFLCTGLPCIPGATSVAFEEMLPGVQVVPSLIGGSPWQWIIICWLSASKKILELGYIKRYLRASLVAQWLRICLPMQGTRVRALVWEGPTCRGATKPVSHNYWACVSGACALQQERPQQWEARAPRWRVAPTCRNWRKPSHRNEDPTQTKINK